MNKQTSRAMLKDIINGLEYNYWIRCQAVGKNITPSYKQV